MLKINESKSGVMRANRSRYLGYGFWSAKGQVIKCRVAPKALKAMKERVRWTTSRTGGRSLEQTAQELKVYLTGWKEYFRLAETPKIFAELDGWVGRRLRMVRLKQWKRGKTIYRGLRAGGASARGAASVAACHYSWWKMSKTSAVHTALPDSYFAKLGVPTLAAV
jgi:hypothetical protein